MNVVARFKMGEALLRSLLPYLTVLFCLCGSLLSSCLDAVGQREALHEVHVDVLRIRIASTFPYSVAFLFIYHA